MLTYLDLQDEVKRRAVRDQGDTQFDEAIKNAVNSSLFRIARDSAWRVMRRQSTFETETSYTTGSGAVSVTNGTKNFSVTGATFLTDGIKVGRRIKFGTDSRVYIIDTITSETAGTIDRDYDGTTSTDTSYEIFPTEEYNLPIQSGHRMFVWHEDFGYPIQLEYILETEFRDSGIDPSQKGTPTMYRMWGEDMVSMQPRAASIMTISSSETTDNNIPITVFGMVSGMPDFEIINTNATNGTTTVAGSKSFQSVERVVKGSSTAGRITVTADSANTTVATLPVGDTTAGIMLRKIQIWPLPDDVFNINVMYYKDPYRLVNDGDVHEMGQEFDEAVILLAVAKIRYENSQKEGDRFLSLWQDEMKSLRSVNVDKLDWHKGLKKPFGLRGSDLLIHKNLGFGQLGGDFGPRFRVR